MRSAPTSCGVSYRIGMPVRIPGSTKSGSRPVICRSACFIGNRSEGTTLATITSDANSPERPTDARRPWIESTISSEVASRRVVRRQCAASSRPSNRPRTVFELPTSTARR
jgi:hypothetical protein